MALRIEDYGLIGDTYAAGLVGKDGSIDWLCVPRFDSGACFAALLGDRNHGRWLLAPVGASLAVRRRYRDDTLILETEFECSQGRVRLIDCMSPRHRLRELIRVVEGLRGRVTMTMELVIRFDYGSIIPWVRRVDDTLTAIGGPDALCLRTPVETRGRDFTTVAEFTVAAGERVPFVLAWHPSNETPPAPVDAVQALADTETWWHEWSAHCTYSG